jgi:hypothetical protein
VELFEESESRLRAAMHRTFLITGLVTGFVDNGIDAGFAKSVAPDFRQRHSAPIKSRQAGGFASVELAFLQF